MESLLLSRTGAAALAATTALAEAWTEDESHGALRAQEIAERKSLPPPFVAKLLVQLSARGLVTGARGRGGGYRLARPPAKISLFDVVGPMERWSEAAMCPFQRRLCASGGRCPLHDEIRALHVSATRILEKTTLDAFRADHRARQRTPKDERRAKTGRRSAP
ncbi:MAG: Rrf2 family transcriptional regulator [Deltaproteobacteria bacterium]|nr:Rrf2 family transcriptional regulator [Deltaproteobacteria bacterium]